MIYTYTFLSAGRSRDMSGTDQVLDATSTAVMTTTATMTADSISSETLR
jgi:hypothetical protein